MIGDINANIEQLKAILRQMRYPLHVLDVQGLHAGRPISMLPILHYAFVDFSAVFYKFHADRGHDIRSKSDLRFVEGVFKILRELLGYQPKLTTTQFFAGGFAERKILLCQDVLRLVQRTHDELCGGRPGARPRRKTALAEVDEADGNKSQCEEALLLSEHGEPQVPPKPEPLEQYPEPARPVPPAAAAVAVGVAPREERGQVAAPEVASPMRALRELLEEIRASLDQRFSQLEQRFAEYVEGADARTTVLEGEVSILSAKVDHVSSALKDLAPVAAPTTQDSCTLGGPSAAPPSKLRPLLTSPTWETAAARPQLNYSPPLQDIAACSSLLDKANYSLPLQDIAAHSSLLHKAGLGSHMDPPLTPPTFLPACPSHIAASIMGQQHRDEHPRLGSGHDVSQEETESLIEKLTCKFRKTEELLSKAQERVARIAVDGPTTPTGHSAFREALGGPGTEPGVARHGALGM